MRLRVLVACEQFGRVRDAFTALGHDACSVDLCPTRSPGRHIIGDAIEEAHRGRYDLLIGHPPCKYLSFAARKYWNLPGRAELREEATRFFFALWEAPIPHICLENPIGHICSLMKPTQTVHPYFFGEAAKKRTCLWLKGLPPLYHSNRTDLFNTATHTAPPAPVYVDKSGKARHFVDSIAGNGRDAEIRRAVTFDSIAQAMAQQWTSHLSHIYRTTK